MKDAFGVSLALVHWPVLDRSKRVVCTNVTNFDVHDIARVSQSYGLEHYFIVNRMKEQLMFVSRMLDHWRVGTGSKYNPMRKTALSKVQGVEYLEQAIASFEVKPWVLATSAREIQGLPRHSFREVRETIQNGLDKPLLLVFGTGFGLDQAVFDQCDGLIEPIRGAPPKDYRHLSVRSAVSICLDRLLGEW